MYAPHSEIQLGFCAELAVPEINAGRQLAAALARTDAVQVFACALYVELSRCEAGGLWSLTSHGCRNRAMPTPAMHQKPGTRHSSVICQVTFVNFCRW